MDRITFDYSTKNIPAASKKYYLKTLIEKTEKLVRNMRWKAFFYMNPKERNQKDTFGFRSKRTPPAAQEMKVFESKMTKMIQNITFSDHLNDFQQKLKKDIKSATANNKIIIKADKTTNYYRTEPKEYESLLTKNIHKDYKKSSKQQTNNINREAKKLAQDLELDDRIETIAERDCFITLKDHKPNFENSPTCRLINPTKSEMGMISKQIMENIVKQTKVATEVNIWRNTYEVLAWFKAIKNRHKAKFITFDIINFYPSITKELLSKALEHASQYTKITTLDKEIIFHSKKTLLFNNGSPWAKKNNNDLFDIPMGSYDGAEACELVVCYMLGQLKEELHNAPLGLYRDDGLMVAYGSPRQIENTKKKICELFSKNNLQITIEANKNIVNFLDVTLNLQTGRHQPYTKPGNTPQYVHIKSSHPPAILKQIPENINKRLAEISSDEAAFKSAVPIYQNALNKSGYKHILKYQEYPEKNDNEAKRKRKRNIIWFNPPFNINVSTNVGKCFLAIVNSCFPKEHPLSKIFNKNTVKISYSCTTNVKSIIDGHNKSNLNKQPEQPKQNKTCNCRDKTKCPLNGTCKQSSIVYQAEVTTGNNTTIQSKEYYVGLTDTDFKIRLANHKQSFNKHDMKNATELSKHIWSLKKRNVNYNITWKILGRATPYNNRTKKCNLCILEKYYILCHPDKSTLNQRCGLVSSCRHINKFLLANH